MNLSLISKIYRKTVLKIEILCALSCLFCLFASTTFAADIERSAGLARRVVDYTPVRGRFRPLKLRREGFFQYTCNECHRVFDTVEGRKSRVAEHVDLKLNHGSNDNCLNCHHKTNRDAYVAHDGKEIPSDRPEELCSQCHGMIYRDWKVGIHGRARGSWNRDEEGWHSLVCTECHDPHDPKFPELVPMPGPAIPGRKTEKEIH